MTARQLKLFSCYLISWKKRLEWILSIVRIDRDQEANVMRENTVFELAMLVRMAKRRYRCATMISIKDMSIGYGRM
jgi:hypothetical protein